MSVMEADDQESGTVLHYAPRHVRLPAEERSIRPILERLSRGESDVRTESRLEPVRVEHLIPIEAPRRRFGWQLIACSALSAGLSAGLAVAAIGWFAPAPGKTEFTHINAAQLDPKAVRIEAAQLDPKSVRTLSFKQDAPPVAPATTAAAPADSGLAKEAPEAAPPIQPKDTPPPSKAEAHENSTHQIAPKELLALWSGIPADLPAEPKVEPVDVSPTQNADDGKSAEAEAPPPAEEKPHRAAASTRRHAQERHRKPHTRTHVVRRQQAEAVAPAAQNANSAPLQSAFQSLFSGSSAQKPQQPAAAPAQPSGY